MGDHRASIKIEMEFHGIKDSCDMYINYIPDDDCVDDRVRMFFSSVYYRGMDKYNDEEEKRYASEHKKEIENAERKELERLSKKYR